MKIRITEFIPLKEDIRPIIGKEYEVLQKRVGRSYYGTANIIEVNGTKVGVWNTECQIVEEV